MTRKATLVEVNVFEEMVPLVSGYLQSYAQADPLVRSEYAFEKYTTTTKTSPSTIVRDLSAHGSDVYAFSCYLWNMGLVKKLLPAMMEANPNADFLLGGPQVMQHAESYLDRQRENLFLCNGEGEKTFANVLRELTEQTPDLTRVKGLSLYRDGALIDTEPEERLRDLDGIPSPFLAGLFDGNYRMTILETNRGCPFRCGFCFWGAATNDKVVKFSEERIRDEITWISKSGTPFIFIADANWGMLKRDVALSEHIAECKKRYELPVFVYFSAAKNSPGKVAEITGVFTEAGLLNAQPISMQSLDAMSLEYIDRTNIKLDAFENLQEDLNEREISSFIELIWPLPGETLSSFKSGLQTLFERRASVIVVYPHLLLHNTPIYRKRDEYGLLTREVEDPAAEAELVVGTSQVSYDDFKEGMWFYYTVLALYNTRSLHGLSRYLHGNGIESYADLYTAFVEYCKTSPDHPFAQFCETSIREADYYEVTNYPIVYHTILHSDRGTFDALLHGFASSQPWWPDDTARALFEIDLFNKPFIYSNTPVPTPSFPLKYLRVLASDASGYRVEVPAEYLPLLEETANVNGLTAPSNGSCVFQVNRAKNQFPAREGQSERDRADYCYGMIMRGAKLLPDWEVVEANSTGS